MFSKIVNVTRDEMDDYEEVEVTIEDYLRVKLDADGDCYIRLTTPHGDRWELEFGAEGQLVSLVFHES